jgi:WD40 repeat protein
MESKRDYKNFNPFPGLRPFAAADNNIFFGRKTERDEVIKKLLKNRYISVIGAAGTGKTSLIYGGVSAGINNKSISFRPGNNPFKNFALGVAECFKKSGIESIDSNLILTDLSKNDTDLPGIITRNLKPGEKVVIIIDQLEDLFRFQSDENADMTAKFIEFLVRLISKAGDDIYFILAMRSEYLGECSHHWELARLVNNSNYLIPEPGFENWKEVIEEPVKYSGATVAPELEELLLNDIRSSNYQLSVFQHVMMRTWSVWQKTAINRPLGISDYNSAGTIKKSIAIHADEIYEELSGNEKQICGVLFKTVTRKGADNKGIRHPSDVKTIKSIAGCTEEELLSVIRKFSNPTCSFILIHEDFDQFENSTIDLQSECLIQSWDLLREWIDNEAASMQMYMRLSEASALYQQGKTGLFKSPDLQSAIKWRQQNNPELSWAIQYNPAFERAMVYLRTSENAFAEEEENRIKKEKKRIKRAGFTSRILTFAILIALGITAYSYFQKMSAEKKAVHAEVARMLVLKQKARSDSTAVIAMDQKSLSDSIAEAALKASREVEAQKILSDKQRMLAEKHVTEVVYLKDQAVEKSKSFERLRMLSLGKTMSLKSLQLNGQKDLQTLLAYQAYLFNKRNDGSSNDPDIYAGLYNVDVLYGGINHKSYKGHAGAIKSIAFVPGKNEFFTSGSDGKVLKWALDKKDETLQVIYSGRDIIEVLAVSPDESWLACGSSSSAIRMIPLKGNTIGYEMNGHKGGIKSLIFSYDGKFLYSAALDGKVLKWDIAARTSVNVSTGQMEITSLDISSKGNFLAGLSNDGNVMVWNPDKSSENFKIETSGKNIKVVRFNPENNLLALGDASGNVEIWDIERQKKISQVKAHDSQINDIRFNSKNQMATTGNDRKIKIFNTKNPADLSDPPVILADNDEFVLVMQFSPDGQMIVSGEAGGSNNLLSRASNADYLARDFCGLVSRNMTQEEWNAYVAKDIPLEKTCQVRNLNIKVEQISSLRK